MSSPVVEVTVVLKDSEKTLRQKSLCYDALTLTPDDARVQSYINEALTNFQGEPEDITFKVSMVIR